MKPTKEQILAMSPGRELDALALEIVFGFPRKKLFPPEYWEEGDEPFAHYYFIPSGKPKRTHMIDARMVPDFSGSIAPAWQIVERMRKKMFLFSLQQFTDGVYVIFCPYEGNLSGTPAQISQWDVEYEAEAITKAALLALL